MYAVAAAVFWYVSKGWTLLPEWFDLRNGLLDVNLLLDVSVMLCDTYSSMSTTLQWSSGVPVSTDTAQPLFLGESMAKPVIWLTQTFCCWNLISCRWVVYMETDPWNLDVLKMTVSDHCEGISNFWMYKYPLLDFESLWSLGPNYQPAHIRVLSCFFPGWSSQKLCHHEDTALPVNGFICTLAHYIIPIFCWAIFPRKVMEM
jgi:hypothetical protein